LPDEGREGGASKQTGRDIADAVAGENGESIFSIITRQWWASVGGIMSLNDILLK
jgi:hypothetical protein